MPRENGVSSFGYASVANTANAPTQLRALSLAVRLRRKWIKSRNRLLSSADFQRWASRSIFTRFIARGQSRSLFDLCSGFVYSQILLAGLRLGLFELLKDEPRSVSDIAKRLNLSERASWRLLRGAASLELVEDLGEGRFALGARGATVLGNPALIKMVEHHEILYKDLADPVALLRRARGELADYWPYAEAADPNNITDEQAASYSALMHESHSFVADHVLDAYSLDKHKRLMDIGGGKGAFVTAAGTRWPDLELVVFDLPPVARIAEQNLQSVQGQNFSGRTRVISGDYMRDPLDHGADVISLVRVLHDVDDDKAKRLLHRIHQALPKNGVLLIAEPMAGAKGAERMGDAYFGFYLLAMGAGQPRTKDRHKELLLGAGFTSVREIPTPLPVQTSLIVAHV